MTLQSTASAGNPLTINEIKAEFSGPNSITSYYRGGGYVPNHGNNAAIPTSGTITVINFLGAGVTYDPTITIGGSYNYDGNGSYYEGYQDPIVGTGGLGSISSSTQLGLSKSSLASTTFLGIRTSSTWNSMGLSYIERTSVQMSGDLTAASANWTSITVGATTILRTSAYAVTYVSGSNYTNWQFFGIVSFGSVTITL